MSIKLPVVQHEGQAVVASYLSAALIINIPGSARPAAKFVFRHMGTAGKWYGSYAGGTPSSSSHDFVVGPGEPHQLDNPPIGDINMKATSDVDVAGEWEAGWAT
jgi:hypothetical protein